MSELPNQPFNNIALSLSGGGYRASSFHLGVLSYLSTIEFKGTSLLERIQILSTVSGGTFTGVKYSTSRSITITYSDLYKFMSEFDWIEGVLNKLSVKEHWDEKKQQSLINAASLIYFEKFESNTFDTLFDKSDFHIKEIIFNATEFTYGLPFRFQKTEYINYPYAYLGNRQVNIPLNALKEIRLADVLAASSCFPLGFEPINFPTDFTYSGSSVLDKLEYSNTKDQWGEFCKFPIGLMDGGIVDNQGIDSVIWAEERLRKNLFQNQDKTKSDNKIIDLFIISDVSSPYMEGFIKSENSNIPLIGNWTFKTLKGISAILLLFSVISYVLIIFVSNKYGIALLSTCGTLLLILSLISGIFSKGFIGIAKSIGVPDLFTNKLDKLNNLRFKTYLNLILNRGRSAKTMISEVFMKQIRRFSFEKVYRDEEWRNRLITNTVYELTPKDVEERKKSNTNKLLNNSILNPNQKIQDIALKAYSMGTTLWFTADQLDNKNEFKHNMLDCLIACGQFTICFNLIEYIEKKLWDNSFENNFTKDKEIALLHNQLVEDWAKFNNNPFWMVEEWNKNLNLKQE